MSDTTIDFDDTDEAGTESSGKGLRAQLERALAEKAELERKWSEAARKARQAELNSLLTAKGVNVKIAKFIPDTVEGADAVEAWLEENADVFGFSINEQTPETAAPEPHDVDAARRIQGIGNAASSPSRLSDIEARIANANTDAEIDSLLEEARSFLL